MMRWSDVGAGLGVAPRMLLRLDLWLAVLRRALFSRVFLGYAFAGFMLFMASRQVLLALQSGGARGGDMQFAPILVLILALVAGPMLMLLLGVALLPYGYWCFNPVVAGRLQQYLDLPQPLEQEPPFARYLAWTLPVLGAAVLFVGAGFVPLRQPLLQVALYVAVTALGALAVINLFTRAALAVFYDAQATDQFLAATRWQRRLVWLPLLVALGWILQWVTFVLLQLPALGWLFGMVRGGAGFGLATALALLVNVLVSAFLAIVFITALLLACGRMPSAGRAAAASELYSVTLPYQRAPVRPAPAPAQPRGPGARWAWGGALALAVLAGGLYFARQPLADTYLSTDSGYRDAPALVTRLGLRLAAGERPQRLIAGYIAAGCSGDIDRLRWMRRLGLDTAEADNLVLACAACQGQAQALHWVLATNPGVQPDRVTLPGDGKRFQRRNALSCAAARSDMPAVQALLARGAQPGALSGSDTPVSIAAERHNWQMISLLLRTDPKAGGDAIFAAFEAARAQGAQAADLLPRMLAAGLSLNARDRFDRTVFHWAALHHDLRLTRALLEHAAALRAEAGPQTPDRQGALPWMLVLRQAEIDGQPLGPDAAELLRLLLPADVDVNAVPRRSPDPARADALPEGWSARAMVLNDPVARAVLGPAFDIGRLPADAGTAWKFRSAQSAEEFVRSASLTQLMRAENPDAPAGGEPRKLSAALVEAGWPQLAQEVKFAIEGKHR